MPLFVFQKGNVRRSILYVHIPKTAGVTVTKFFKRLSASSFFDNNLNAALGPLRCPAQHFHYPLLESILDFEQVDTAFAIVRHPLERAKSDFLWAHRNVPQPQDLPNFARWLDSMFSDYQRNPFVLDNHIRPQSEFVGPKIGIIRKIEDGIEQVLADVLERSGIKCAFNTSEMIGKENTSTSHHGLKTSDILADDRAMKLIRDFYAEDFERFGYTVADRKL